VKLDLGRSVDARIWQRPQIEFMYGSEREGGHKAGRGIRESLGSIVRILWDTLRERDLTWSFRHREERFINQVWPRTDIRFNTQEELPQPDIEEQVDG
jgi:hypothetical protein